MAHAIPHSSTFEGLSRTVLQYSEAFKNLVEKAKLGPLSDADWKPLEELVDVAAFERVGVFLGPQAEVIDWKTYRQYITKYGALSDWEGTLRRVTEVPNLVILELEERNTMNGEIDVANTVTIYEFGADGKLRHLDVYVSPRGKRPA